MPLNDILLIGLIPARGGSKGVPGKNMRKLIGRPLIDFSILAAQQSKRIDCLYVSSEDQAILRHAQKMGALVILRPEEFASDTASAVSVVEHFIGSISPPMLKQDPYIVYLQPTSPFRNASHIDDALKLMLDLNAQSLTSVSETEQSPFKMFTLDAKGRLQSLFDEKLSNVRRQDLPVVFAPNGAIYVFRVSEFKAKGGFPSNGSLPFVMNCQDSLDIDTEEDISCAELILRGK